MLKTTPNNVNQAVIYSQLSFFEWVGRAMMDFGFGSVIDKFEDYFGRRISKYLLSIVGVAVVSGCFGVIANYVVIPSYNIYKYFIGNDVQAIFDVNNTITTIIGFGLLILLGVFVVVFIQFKIFVSRFNNSYQFIDENMSDEMVLSITSAALAHLEMSRDDKKSKRLFRRWHLARRYVKFVDSRQKRLQGTEEKKQP